MDPNNGIESTNIYASSTYHYVIKVCVGTASCLSIIGASLIIVTHLAYPELRTKLRQILVNLSIADLISATANLVGISINFYKYLDPRHVPSQNPQSDAYHCVCIVQGAFGVFGTNSSILWTMSMAVFMFVVVVMKQPRLAEKQLPVHYILCWGLPAVITSVFGAVGWLGFEPKTTAGWCDIQATHYINSSSTYYYTVAPVVIRNTLFLYTSFILLPPMFIAIRWSLSRMYQRNRRSFIGSEEAVKAADLKLVLIPLVFILLRMWSIIADPFTYFVGSSLRASFRNSPLLALLFFIKGIGVSLQGCFNALLFVGLSKKVRTRLVTTVTTNRCYRHCRPHTTSDTCQDVQDDPEEGGSVITPTITAMSDLYRGPPVHLNVNTPLIQSNSRDSNSLHQSLLVSINI